MQILILDDTLTQVSVLTNFISLEFVRNYCDTGGFQITVNLNENNAKELEVGRIIYLDPLRCGVIERVSIDRTGESGSEMIHVSGCELKDIIAQRIAAMPLGEDFIEYVEETTEYIVRSLIEDNIINPTDTNRKIGFVRLNTYGALGSERNITVLPKNLGNLINVVLLPLDELGLKCYTDLTSKTAEFSVYKGLDRTLNQDKNPCAIFSFELGTSLSSRVGKNTAGLKNLVYATNGLYGTSKLVEEVYKDEVPTGLMRKELYREYKFDVTADDLQTSGISYINQNGPDVSATGSPMLNEPEYDLGDEITFYDSKNGTPMDLRVIQIAYIYQGTNKETKKLTFGKEPLDIAQALRAKL